MFFYTDEMESCCQLVGTNKSGICLICRFFKKFYGDVAFCVLNNYVVKRTCNRVAKHFMGEQNKILSDLFTQSCQLY